VFLENETTRTTRELAHTESTRGRERETEEEERERALKRERRTTERRSEKHKAPRSSDYEPQTVPFMDENYSSWMRLVRLLFQTTVGFVDEKH
jgi:hypothetical protein